MTKFMDRSFSVHAGTGQEYRDNWDRIFKKDADGRSTGEATSPCFRCNRTGAHAGWCNWQRRPDAPARHPNLDNCDAGTCETCIHERRTGERANPCPSPTSSSSSVSSSSPSSPSSSASSTSAEPGTGEPLTELARLRRIEGAARDVVNIALNDAGPEAFATMSALRSALRSRQPCIHEIRGLPFYVWIGNDDHGGKCADCYPRTKPDEPNFGGSARHYGQPRG